jgi:hypothetical protein
MTTNHTNTFKAINAFFGALDKTQTLAQAVLAAAKADGLKTWESIYPLAVRAAGKHYGVAVAIAEGGRSAGKPQLDQDSPKYETAKKAVSRLREACVGTNEAKGASKVDPVAQLVAKYGKLTAAQQRRFMREIAE